ncbi:MAG: hypothetical protein VW709_03645, partial [Rickettsiales bacterium]
LCKLKAAYRPRFLLWLLLCVRQFTRAAVFGIGHSPVGTHQCRVGESQNDHVEIVRRHGRPDAGRNSLQIEINRALYMNEETFERTAYYPTLKSHLTKMIEIVGNYALGRVGAKAAE